MEQNITQCHFQGESMDITDVNQWSIQMCSKANDSVEVHGPKIVRMSLQRVVLLFCLGRRRRLMIRKIQVRVWWICWSRCMKTVTMRWNAQLPSHGVSHVKNNLEWICSHIELLSEQFLGRQFAWNVDKLSKLFPKCLSEIDRKFMWY